MTIMPVYRSDLIILAFNASQSCFLLLCVVLLHLHNLSIPSFLDTLLTNDE